MSATIAQRPSRHDAPAGQSTTDDAPRWHAALPWLVLAAVMAVTAAVLMHAGRDTTFFYDDWPVIQERLDWSVYNLLRPHNEHLQVFPMVLYKLLFETVGLHAHWVYRAALVALNLLTGLLLFLYARKRIGAWPAIALAACLMLMSASWYNLIYSFQVNFVGAMAAGLGALLAMDRGTRRWDLVAALLLGVSIGSSSVGFPFLAGAIVEVLLRPDRKSRWWVVGIPIIAYGLWTLKYGTGSSIRLHNAPAIPGFTIDGADDSTGHIVGLGADIGMILFVVLVAVVIHEALRPGRITPRLLGLIAMPLSFWALTALGRADQGIEADANRYLYASGLMVGLVALEVARRYPMSRRLMWIVTGLLAFGAVANANGVKGGGDQLRLWTVPGKDALTAMELAGEERVNPFLSPDNTQPFIVANRYFRAVRRYGSSPAFTLAEIRREEEARKRGVDDHSQGILEMKIKPVARGARVGTAAPEIEQAAGTSAPSRRGCVRLAPAKPGNAFEVAPSSGALVVVAGEAPVEVRARRFAAEFSQGALGKVAANGAGRVPFVTDNAPDPWHAQLKSAAPFEVCSPRA